MISYNCKNCGSPLLLNGNEKKVVCSYCNTEFIYDVKDSKQDVGNLLELASNAEEAENYIEAMQYYNLVLLNEENNFYALMGKAFSSLAVYTYDKLNIKEFKCYFEKAIENKGNIDDVELHTLILYKIWATLIYSVNTATDIFVNKYTTNPLSAKEYVDNLLCLHEIQKIISKVIDSVDIENVTEDYIVGYREFKTASTAHGGQIFNVAKKYRVKLDKETIKEIKNFMKLAETSLKTFNKKHK